MRPTRRPRHRQERLLNAVGADAVAAPTPGTPPEDEKAVAEFWRNVVDVVNGEIGLGVGGTMGTATNLGSMDAEGAIGVAVGVVVSLVGVIWDTSDAVALSVDLNRAGKKAVETPDLTLALTDADLFGELLRDFVASTLQFSDPQFANALTPNADCQRDLAPQSAPSHEVTDPTWTVSGSGLPAVSRTRLGGLEEGEASGGGFIPAPVAWSLSSVAGAAVPRFQERNDVDYIAWGFEGYDGPNEQSYSGNRNGEWNLGWTSPNNGQSFAKTFKQYLIPLEADVAAFASTDTWRGQTGGAGIRAAPFENGFPAGNGTYLTAVGPGVEKVNFRGSTDSAAAGGLCIEVFGAICEANAIVVSASLGGAYRSPGIDFGWPVPAPSTPECQSVAVKGGLFAVGYVAPGNACAGAGDFAARHRPYMRFQAPDRSFWYAWLVKDRLVEVRATTYKGAATVDETCDEMADGQWCIKPPSTGIRAGDEILIQEVRSGQAPLASALRKVLKVNDDGLLVVSHLSCMRASSGDDCLRLRDYVSTITGSWVKAPSPAPATYRLHVLATPKPGETCPVSATPDLTGSCAISRTISFLAQDDKPYRAELQIPGAGPLATTAAVRSARAGGAATEAPSIGVQPEDAAVAAGVSATFTASGNGEPAPAAQWQTSTDGGTTWTDIPGATSRTYVIPAVAAGDSGHRFRAVFTNGAGSATSRFATLGVVAPPAITALDVSSATITRDGTVRAKATVTGTPRPLTLWQVSYDGGETWTDTGQIDPELELYLPKQPIPEQASESLGAFTGRIALRLRAEGPGGVRYSKVANLRVVDTFADVTVTPATPSTTAARGRALRLVFVVRERNGIARSGVRVEAPVPAGWTGVRLARVSGPAATCTGGATPSCTIASFPASGVARFALTGKPTALGTSTARVALVLPEPDAYPSNDAGEVEVRVTRPAADLAVTGTTALRALPRARFAAALTVANVGALPSTGTTLRVALPKGVKALAAGSRRIACTRARVVVCRLGKLEPGATVRVPLRLSSTTFGRKAVVARVRSTAADAAPADNAVTLVTLLGADLALDGAASTDALPGATYTATLTVRNLGRSQSKGARLGLVAPAGVTIVSATSASGACPTAPAAACALPAVKPGASTVVRVTMTAAQAGPKTLVARITGGAPLDPDTTNNRLALDTVID